MVIVSADTSKVHAGETRVRRLSANTTSPPPTGVRASGATTTSSAAHGPLGCGQRRRASASAAWTCAASGVPLGSWIVGTAARSTDGVIEAAACTAPGFDDAESAPSLDPTSSRPIANTISAAVPSTMTRRTQ